VSEKSVNSNTLTTFSAREDYIENKPLSDLDTSLRWLVSFTFRPPCFQEKSVLCRFRNGCLGALEKSGIYCVCLESNCDSLVVQPVVQFLSRTCYPWCYAK